MTRKYIRGSRSIDGLHSRLTAKLKKTYQFEKLTGLIFNWQRFNFGDSLVEEKPSFQVQSLRVVSRVGPNGKQVNQIVFSLIQRMGVVIKNGEFVQYYDPKNEQPTGGVEVQGGSTLIFDLDSENVRLRYAISKPLFEPKQDDKGPRLPSQRVMNQHNYQTEVLPMSISEYAKYFGVGHDNRLGHMFSILHNH